ncbi:MAG: UDP-N-acetylglucosamine--N-acetylmuramyl-(pentapeptide) pyrophosphoryl-undecaprenol N-acetylglucosamine transferase [Patescibacteria group bacterium]|nr:UDP-N-acetylglucosamine--N-acetylmuramyl-(pentapeptide) pyrophosphoryl-undecaprenol N-acetylglucosamine transferase [Patescibacteria group bacterium]
MPTLAVAAALKDKSKDIVLLYVGSTKPADRELVESAGIEFRAISAGKLRRYFSLENVADVFRFFRGVGQAKKIIADFAPDIVFAKGGYVSLPVVLAAARAGVPVVVHESDNRLGLSNRLSLRAATRVAVAYPIAQYLKNNPKLSQYKAKLVYTGLPMDVDLLKTQPRTFFHNRRKTLMVAGGSQGAKAINETFWKILPEVLTNYNVIHQTGTLSFERAKAEKTTLPDTLAENYFIFDFDIRTYREGLLAADAIVSRSGSSVFDFQAFGVPAILIPLPGSAGDHQVRNAHFLTETGAATALDQKKLTPEKLLAMIEQVLNEDDVREVMTQKMQELGKISIGASSSVADLILGLVK